MKVSLNWLADYVDLSGLTPEQIAGNLTDIGLEVEGIDNQAAFTGEVVIGHVLKADPHPNADSLRLCQVDVGEAEPLTIVCGAPNARAGLSVVVAKIGATLPGDFKIKKSKIRGETSMGMMCSEKELEISESNEGIIEVAGSHKVGASAAQALGIGDTVFEVNVTPNRADCLGVIGIARDLAAKLGKPLKKPDTFKEGMRPSSVKVAIEDPQSCGRFVALEVSGIKVGKSPAWLEKRLVASGMRPINLVVDATNYVMLETAQPIHAYDARMVNGSILKVRAAKEGETLVTLDGATRALASGDLVITDEKKILGLAGIMGGQNSEVKDDTSTIVIEVASFAAQRIRRTAKRLGLRSEASYRFERGTDTDNAAWVASRVATLIASLSGPSASVSAMTDEYPADLAKRVIALRLSHAKQFLGLPSLPRVEAEGILSRLEFELLDSTDDRLVYEVPFFRGDIEREVDLVEEVGRIYGYDKIPYQLPTMNIRPNQEDPFIGFLETVRAVAGSLSLRETVSFPFVADSEERALNLTLEHPLQSSVRLENPLSEDHRNLATTLLHGLLRATSENRKRGHKGGRLFELGRGYFDVQAVTPRLAMSQHFRALLRHGRHISGRARSDQGRPVERHWLCGVLDQPFFSKTWNGAQEEASFFHAKALVFEFADALGLAPEKDLDLVRPSASELPFLHPGASAILRLNGKYAGFLGELHPKSASDLGLAEGGVPVVFELDLEVFFEAKSRGIIRASAPTKFPPIHRDFAFLVPEKVEHKDVVSAYQKFKGKKYLSEFKLFDVYEGSNLGVGLKSMAYSLVFVSPERTLSDTDIEGETQGLLQWFKETLGATQR